MGLEDDEFSTQASVRIAYEAIDAGAQMEIIRIFKDAVRAASPQSTFPQEDNDWRNHFSNPSEGDLLAPTQRFRLVLKGSPLDDVQGQNTIKLKAVSQDHIVTIEVPILLLKQKDVPRTMTEHMIRFFRRRFGKSE